MIKFTLLALCLAVAANQVYSQDMLLELLNSKSCPQYDGMSNLEYQKSLGVWYAIAMATSNAFPNNVKCSKIDVSVTPDKVFVFNGTMVREDDSLLNFVMNFDTDVNDPHDLFYNVTARDRSVFGDEEREIKVKFSPIYTDYDNIMIFYQCYNEKSNSIVHKNEEYYIFVRDRKFDSLSVFERALAVLDNYDVDYNEMKFIYNGPNCKN